MKRLLFVVAALALPAASAWAAPVVEEAPRADEGQPRLFGIPMESIEVGAGVMNYTGEAAPQIAPGPAWGIRAVLDATKPVDLELQYQGGRNTLIDIPDAVDTFHMYTNGLGANAKVDPIVLNEIVRPYLLTGIGLNRLSVSKSTQISSDFRSDFVGSIPLAAGLDVDVAKNVFLSGRGQYNILFDNELLTQQDNTSSDNWDLTLNIGVSKF